MADFECRLRQFRQQRGLTQEQLAAMTGVRRETIMRLEKAQYNPSLKLAVDISRAVGAPIEEIFLFPLPDSPPTSASDSGNSSCTAPW